MLWDVSTTTVETENEGQVGMTWLRRSDGYRLSVMIVSDSIFRQATATIINGASTSLFRFCLQERFWEPAVMVAHTQLVLERCHQRVTLLWSKRGTKPTEAEVREMVKYELWSMLA